MKYRLEEKFMASGVPYGYCCCGCGEQTEIAKRSIRETGYVANEPRLHRHGHGAKRVDPETAYRVEDRGYETPCWIWKHGCNDKGYGLIYWRKQRGYAHRWFYERQHGPITAGAELDHLCRNRPCVNPDHLEPVDHPTNMRRAKTTKLTLEDARAIRRQEGKKTHREIAEEFGISKGYVWSILRERKWKDPEGSGVSR